MFKKISDDLMKAIKARDELRTSVLRMMKSKINYVAPKGDIPDSEILKILNKYSKELKESIEIAEKVGRTDISDQVKKELKIVEEYLPQPLSDDQIQQLVKEAIQKLGVTSPREIGKVMKEVLLQQPTIDGAKVKNFVLANLGA